jgi:hypothetical protein
MMFNVPHKRSLYMDQISIDKRNVPPPLAPTTIQETKSTKGSSIACSRSNWTNEQLEEAMDVVEKRQLP